MAEIVARFSDGRFLVQESRVMETQYVSGGVPVRIGLVQTVEKVISIDTLISGYPGQNVAAPLNEIRIGTGTASGPMGGGVGSSNLRDIIIPVLRRRDLYGLVSGDHILSGYAAADQLSGLILSGIVYGDQLTSGCRTSGYLTILANVIGY